MNRRTDGEREILRELVAHARDAWTADNASAYGDWCAETDHNAEWDRQERLTEALESRWEPADFFGPDGEPF